MVAALDSTCHAVRCAGNLPGSHVREPPGPDQLFQVEASYSGTRAFCSAAAAMKVAQASVQQAAADAASRWAED
jgi:hypothetical protein